MLNIQKVLHPTDFSDHADAALPHAVKWAKEHDAELHLFHAIVLHTSDPAILEGIFPTHAEVEREAVKWANERLAEVAPEADATGLTIRTGTLRSISAAPAVLQYAHEQDVDLIVMGTHGRRGLRRMILGSVTEETVRRSEVPVLTVPRPRDEAPPTEPPERILVPLDFSEHGDTALAYAAEIAGRYGARLQVLHVINELAYPDPYFAEAATARAMFKAAEERVPAALEERAGKVVGPGVETEIYLEVGGAAAKIAEFAEEYDSDLAVLSSHGRRGVKRAFLGSVTEGVIRRIGIPTLTVKAFGKSLLPGPVPETEPDAEEE